MIPPDLTKVENESPREALGNVIEAMRWEASVAREVAITGVSVSPTLGALSRHIEAWASRLERACQRMDAEQSPPEGPWRFIGQVTEGGDWHIQHDLTHDCMSFWRERDAHAVADALNRVAVSPTAPPAEQDTPQ